MKFVRYTNPEALADVLGPCPRGHCDGATVTGSVWTGDPEPTHVRITCDNERCIAEAVQLITKHQEANT